MPEFPPYFKLASCETVQWWSLGEALEISASIGFPIRQKSVSSRPRNCPHCGQKYPPWRAESARAFSCFSFVPRNRRVCVENSPPRGPCPALDRRIAQKGSQALTRGVPRCPPASCGYASVPLFPPAVEAIVRLFCGRPPQIAEADFRNDREILGAARAEEQRHLCRDLRSLLFRHALP